MGGNKLAPWLTKYAAAVPKEEAIVELGCWLGAGTQYLVRPEGELHVFDRFSASRSEIAKAKAFGIHLEPKQNTLPLVKASLPARVHYHRGEIYFASYHGPPIGLYVDDAAKHRNVWLRAMKTFEPHFRSGTILVLMDYFYERYDTQREYAVKWQMLEERIGYTSTAVFRVP